MLRMVVSFGFVDLHNPLMCLNIPACASFALGMSVHCYKVYLEYRNAAIGIFYLIIFRLL